MDLEEIKLKLNKLKTLDKNLTIFGSSKHKYENNATLSEEQILAYENKNQITLPEDYRNFLLHIGNGGAGPFYGLYELGASEGMAPNPSNPFSLSGDARLRMSEVYEQVGEQLAELEIEDEEQADEMWETLFTKLCDGADCGFVFLCTEGCGMDSILIVNGNAYGSVWYFDFANDAGVFPLTNPATGSPIRFTDWYEIWLDSAIAHLENETEMFSSYADYIMPEPEEMDGQA